MKINLFGNPEGSSGYATHTRELMKALIKEGVEVTTGDEVGTPCLAITLPEHWEIKSGNRHKPFMPFLVFEGTQLSKGWVNACNQEHVTEILTPSEYVKEVAIRSGVNKPVTVAPHGVDTELFNEKVTPETKVKGTNFKFFMLGGWAQGIKDRKGFQYAIKAFCEEFSKEEPVELYWKINMVYNPQLNIQEELKKLKLPENRPEIHIIPVSIPYEELPALYKAMDCFIAPSMAEAFDIPCLESMAVGVPVIATAYGGHTDYINNENGWLINIEQMIPSTGEPKHIYENALWAEPDIKSMKEAMREAYENKKLLKTKGTKALKTAKHYTWTNTAKIIKQRMEEYQ